MAAYESTDNARFMEEVQKYECVYNKFHSKYKNKFVKLNCWVKIGEQFALSPEEAEKRFKNIQSSYGLYLKKVKNIPSGSGRDAIPSSNEFNHLDSLKPLIVHRESQSNFKLTDKVEDKSDGEQYQEEGFNFDSLPSAFDNAAESDQESRPESCNSDISNLQFSSGNMEDNGSQGQDPLTQKEIILGNREIKKANTSTQKGEDSEVQLAQKFVTPNKSSTTAKQKLKEKPWHAAKSKQLKVDIDMELSFLVLRNCYTIPYLSISNFQIYHVQFFPGIPSILRWSAMV